MREQLLVDKDNLMRQLQLARMDCVRLEGALAYIEGKLKETENDGKPDTEK